ncbi:MAG TPA: hypothetical protein VMJ10_14240, partial [Kofleriaceae bacterium]|nr:hypothetical protein [Kofleriaceae bacterium]
YKYGEQKWERCTKGGATLAEVPLRMEGAHPIIYWGNGHNKVFENRGGYGHACGAGKPEKADGDLAGWNVKNPSNELADDPGRVIILRPLPVDLDAVGYDHSSGRREALADHYAPWIYRLSSLELAREGKIDDAKTLGLDRYLYVDVEVADVGGEGDSYCTPIVRGGFKLRAITTAGTAISSPQITKAYAGGGHRDWKRVAIALPAGVHAADITGFVFDAYDKDGIYVTGLGDAFVPRAVGDNGATLDYVRRGVATFTDYIDDDRSTCAAGKITYEGTDYRCMGGQVQLVGR